MAFTDLDTVKTALNISLADTSRDALLQAIVDGVNAEFLNVFGLTSCAPTVYVGTFDILDSYCRQIVLPQYPIITLDQVKIDEGVLDNSGGRAYYEGRPIGWGILLRGHMRYWPSGSQRIEVTHTAGWAGGTPPADLQRAAVSLAVFIFNTEPKSGFVSERIGQYSYKLGSGSGGGSGAGGAEAGGWPSAVTRVLANHRRIFASGI